MVANREGILYEGTFGQTDAANDIDVRFGPTASSSGAWIAWPARYNRERPRVTDTVAPPCVEQLPRRAIEISSGDLRDL